MKRTIITLAATLITIKTAKELKALARSKWNLESYLLGKQIDRAERETEKNKRQHRRDIGRKLAGHNAMAGHGRRSLSGHNVIFDDNTGDGQNYHQALSD